MAGENQGGGGLPKLDFAKFPLYGQDDERFAEINNAQLAAVEALRQRYDKPNWFKVAAGFAKPQLGGFTASLGSAAEALGETEEQRRAAQLPIAQMRLELLQQGAIMGAHKTVNDEIKSWTASHPGQIPPPHKISEWAAKSPDNPAVKALEKAYENKQKEQTLDYQRMELKSRMNVPATEADIAKLNPDVVIPPAEAPLTTTTQPPSANVVKPVQPPSEVKPEAAAPSEVAPVTPTAPTEGKPEAKEEKTKYRTLPNGRPATEDVYKLHEQGIPVISNLRTPEEQEKLKHHQDPNTGRWYTDKNLPVAENSKHFTGDAIDVENSKKLSAEKRKILTEAGWYQPKWALDPKSNQYDPNHWERLSSAAKKDEGGMYPRTIPKPNTTYMGADDRKMENERYQKNAEETEAPYAKKIAGLSTIFSGSNPDYTKIKNTYGSTIKMIESNPLVAQRLFAMVRNSDPLIAALNEGVGIHAGNLTANINLPAKAYIDANLSESDKAFGDKLFSNLITLAIGNLKQQGVDMGKVPQGEYMKALGQFVNPDMTALAALNSLHHQRAEFNHAKEYYDAVMKDLKRVDPHSPTRFADIHNNSQELPRIARKYDYIHETYNKNFQDEINKLKSKGK